MNQEDETDVLRKRANYHQSVLAEIRKLRDKAEIQLDKED